MGAGLLVQRPRCNKTINFLGLSKHPPSCHRSLLESCSILPSLSRIGLKDVGCPVVMHTDPSPAPNDSRCENDLWVSIPVTASQMIPYPTSNRAANATASATALTAVSSSARPTCTTSPSLRPWSGNWKILLRSKHGRRPTAIPITMSTLISEMKPPRAGVRSGAQRWQTVPGFLPRGPWGCGLAVTGRILGHNTLPAMWTCIMLLQPRSNALAVEPVLAGQKGDFVPELYIVHADRAFCFAVSAQHVFVNLFRWERGDSGGRSRTGGRRTVMLFHEL